jgi:hypothetical protein
MKNIHILPTAEEFALKDGWEKVIDHVTIKRMQDFAKLHVEAALKAAKKKTYKKVNMRHYEDELYKDEILTNTIIKSYPLNNIK